MNQTSPYSPFKIVFESTKFKVTDKLLGEGGSGVVNRGFSKHTESPVAIKTVFDRSVAEIEVIGLQFEIPHATRFRDEFTRDHEEYSIVMDEIVGKNVFDTYLCPEQSKTKLNLREITSIACQLFEVLEDLEDKNLVNHDIKPQNLIWNRLANALTVVDLASIRQVDESCDSDPNITVEYLAPEVILGADADCSYNIWSSACVLFELIVGEKLFSVHPKDLEEYDFILMQIVREIGKPTAEYLQRYDRAFECFDENQESIKDWNIPERAHWTIRLKEALVLKGATAEELQQWQKLLASMLRYENRACPKDLLANPLCSNEIKVHLLFDRMNKCMMQLRRVTKEDALMDLTLDLRYQKNCCLHIPKDAQDAYVVVVNKGIKEAQATLTLRNGEKLDISAYQTQVEPAKRLLFPDN